MKKWLLIFALCSLPLPAYAQTFFIDNAKVVTNTASGTLDKADIIIQDGKITRIAAQLTPPDNATQIDGTNQWVTPGLFLAYSQIGLVDIGLESATNDIRAAEANTSVSDLAADSFNPKSSAIAITRIEGITHAAIIPGAGHNIFGGTGAIVTTSGQFDSIISSESFVFVQLGERGTGLAGGSRAAALSQLRAALDDASAYPARFKSPRDGDALSRRDAAALASAARGQIPLIIAANRAADIMNIIQLKKDYGNLDIIIAGGAEGWLITDALKAAQIKIMVDPHENLPSSFDQAGTRADNIILLDEAGVDYAIMNWTQDPGHNGRVLPQHAGNAVANGLSWDKAFRAISLVPATWFNLDTATLASGSDTVVIWDGDPLEITSSPQFIMIEGVIQSLETRQTKLRDRYNPLKADILPFKYR